MNDLASLKSVLIANFWPLVIAAILLGVLWAIILFVSRALLRAFDK